MTDEVFQEVRYIDVRVSQNFSPIQGGNTILTCLKIPVFSVQQGIAILELVFAVDPKTIKTINVHRVNKIYGSARYDYKLVREYLEDETKQILTAYFKFNRKKYIK